MKNVFPVQFISSVIFMLQNTEYDPRDFLSWFWSARSIAKVKGVRSVEWTQKANLLAWMLGIILAVICACAVLISVLNSYETGYLFVSAGVLIAAPILSVHLLIIPLIFGSFFIQRPKEKAAYARAQRVFSGLEVPVIAISGSFGKTSTRNVIVSVLSAGMKVATPRNNHNTPLGLSIFADEIQEDDKAVVVELGEYVPGDVAYLAALVQPSIGVVSGINRQHMMRMKTKERTIATIMELADFVPAQKLYINTESEWAQEAAKKQYVHFNENKVGKWLVTDAESNLQGSKFTLKKGKQSMSLKTQLLGAYQIAPIAAAAVIADSLGLSHDEIQKGVDSIEAFERRFEPIILEDNVTLIDDTYNGNPSGFRAGMQFLNELKHEGRKIYATPGIIELGSEAFDVHWALGVELAGANIDVVVFFDTPLSRVMHQAYEEAGGSAEVLVVDDQVSFKTDIEHFVRPNDVVLMQNSQREEYFYLQ